MSAVPTTPRRQKSLRRQNAAAPSGLVLSNRYLSLLAAFSLVFTFANTNGEYMLSRIVSDYAAGRGRVRPGRR